FRRVQLQRDDGSGVLKCAVVIASVRRRVTHRRSQYLNHYSYPAKLSLMMPSGTLVSLNENRDGTFTAIMSGTLDNYAVLFNEFGLASDYEMVLHCLRRSVCVLPHIHV